MSKPSITDKEISFVTDALSHSDVGVGEYILSFENLWATYNNKKYGVSCNSGTNAIYLALKALGIGYGDEVIVPEYTMVATAWAVTYTGAKPVFVDCGDDLLMDASLVRKAITHRTKAIIIVPIYGRTPQYPETEIPIIEDMAEAHGMQPRGKIACYSFYGNKILTTGEGGMCVTDDVKIAEEMRKLANMYFDDKRSMIHQKIAHNFRMTNIQAAVGLAQVMRIEEILKKRKEIESWYMEGTPQDMLMPKRDVLWMYDIQTDHQEELKAYLEENGIPSRYGFKPMSMQPMYIGDYKKLNAYKWSKRILYLPTYTDLTQEEVETSCQKISAFSSRKS